MFLFDRLSWFVSMVLMGCWIGFVWLCVFFSNFWFVFCKVLVDKVVVVVGICFGYCCWGGDILVWDCGVECGI